MPGPGFSNGVKAASKLPSGYELHKIPRFFIQKDVHNLLNRKIYGLLHFVGFQYVSSSKAKLDKIMVRAKNFFNGLAEVPFSYMRLGYPFS